MRANLTLPALLLVVLACGTNTTAGDPAAVRNGMLGAVSQDPRLAKQVRLAPDDYDALAQRMSAVPGVQAADYAGDTLGTVYVQVLGGGVMVYRHIKDDWSELDTLPPEADFSGQLNPTWNAGWTTTPVDAPLKRGSAATADNNTFFSRFPTATMNPDPNYTRDQGLACPSEGKIALVDFQYSAMGENERDAMTVDGVMLYDRIRAMADAAGFTFDFYMDDQINTTNFNKLEDYTIVIVIAHGSFPFGNADTAHRLNIAMPSIVTPELYDENRVMLYSMTQKEAWKKGYVFQMVDEDKTYVKWTPLLFRDLYHPSVPQLFMLNSCWGLLTKDDQGFGRRTDKTWAWGKAAKYTLYNLGDGLMDAGVKVVFGYVSPSSPMAILENTMTFFRRMYGGNFSGDHPPAQFPQTYWPTCMGAQTYFRRPESPDKPVYANKNRGGSIYTMYGVPQNQYFRNVCAQGNQHAMIQDFTLSVGAPASDLLACWTKWWSRGIDPTRQDDEYCWMGDPKATEEQTHLAACGVKIARKVTNVMLQ